MRYPAIVLAFFLIGTSQIIGAPAANPTIVTRIGKGTPLTAVEMDANFVNLSNYVVNQRIRTDATLQDDGTLKTNAVDQYRVALNASKRYVLTDLSTVANTWGTALITNPPASLALSDLTGIPLWLKVKTPNTAGTTLYISNVVSGSISAGVRKKGNQQLELGDTIADQYIELVYDGTYFQVLSASAQTNVQEVAIPAGSKGLKIRRNSSTPASQIDITADSVVLTNKLDASFRLVKVVSLTINAAGTGANGTDVSITPATNTWYYLYVINDGTTTAGLLSAHASAPTVPTGYNNLALVGQVYNAGVGTWAMEHILELGPTTKLISGLSPVPPAAGVIFVVPHPLGIAPAFLNWVLVASATDGTIAVAGDELPVLSLERNDNGRECSYVRATATNVYCRFMSANYDLATPSTTAATAIATNSYRMKAYAQW